MLIGNRYSDNKLYRGIRHYDHLPLTSGDLHEYADILQMKNALFMNNIIGSGPLNEPNCIISSTGVSLDTPSIVLVDGDISLIHSDNSPLVSMDSIKSAGYTDGVVCIVGWYQSLTASSTLRAYGGVNNSILENDLIDPDLNIQVSTRYQLRWDVILLDSHLYDTGEEISFNLPNRDATGELNAGSTLITVDASSSNVRVAKKPASMDYAVSDLYIIPIMRYKYDGTSITEIYTQRAVRPLGANQFLKSVEEPDTSIKYDEGTIWYNPESYRFKFYVEGVGFVPTASDLTFVQYHNSVAVTEEHLSSVDIGIKTLTRADILQVVYNGAVLIAEQNYSIDYENNSINLIDFDTVIGDMITFIAIKLVDTNSINSIAKEFQDHIDLSASSIRKGHVSLSDSASKSKGIEAGVAATPKAVYDATTIIDSVTSKKYRLTVTNGVLGISEIVE